MKKKQKGSILAFAVIIMSFLMVIAIGLVASSILIRKGADISSNSTSAFQNTDKGMELFLYELYENTKPFNTLNDLAKSIDKNLDGEYNCYNNDGVAVIGGDNSEFKIISYKEVDPTDPNNEGKDLGIADSCGIEIARIKKVKVTGNFGTATRSIEVNLSDSLKRGLKGRWTFEENSESVRLYGKGAVGAPMAKDRSKNDYILTLCPIDEDADLPDTAHNDLCPLMAIADVGVEEGFFMNHNPKYNTTKEGDPDENRNCGSTTTISCGAYVPGIFDIGSVGASKDGSSIKNPINYDVEPDDAEYYSQEDNVGRIGTEALEFNGYSHYLAPNFDENARSDDWEPGSRNSPNANYVGEGYRENLSLDGSEGMSISLWFNNNSETGGEDGDGTGKQILVSKTEAEDDNNGYELYLEDENIVFRVNGQDVKLDNVASGQWHHVVARYDQNPDSKSGIIIDGGGPGNEKFGLTTAGTVNDDSKIPLFMGGFYEGNNDKEFDIEKFEGGFGGMMDHVEIFDRYLINFEAQKMCNMAAGEGWQADSQNIDDLCKGVEW